MYSEEIKKLLELRNYLVTNEEFVKICKSKQIDHVKYENEVFKLWTNDNYAFTLKIKK